MIEYKGYTGTFEFDPELRLFAGHVVDLRDEIYFEGGSVEELEVHATSGGPLPRSLRDKR